MCNALIFIFHKLNGITTITYKIVNKLYDLDFWHWFDLDLEFDLDDLKKQIFFKICEFCEVMWRKSVTSYVKTETTNRMRPSIRNILQPTRNVYDFRFQSYGSKGDFHGSWYVWPWHFKVIWLLRIHHLLRCTTGVNIEAICSLITEICHIEIWRNSLYFIMGIFVAMETYVTFFGSIHFFWKITSDRSKQYVCQFWEESVENWRF